MTISAFVLSKKLKYPKKLNFRKNRKSSIFSVKAKIGIKKAPSSKMEKGALAYLGLIINN
jgi:hypothetical protein